VTVEDASVKGAFTFLFTDVEGSTRTWEREPDAMERWLASHDRILTEAITAQGGRVFKHTGDGLCAVFAAASAAARAARDVQLAVAGADAQALGPLRVRIAVHTGGARERAGDFYGPALNRCARLLDIGHAGQVLLSGATADMIGDPSTIGSGITLVDVGTHRLRDLQQPLRVWQLAAPGLQREFPPLRSLDLFVHNLPVQRSSFVGRATEKRVVHERLGAHRLVTVTGVGGCGKTRLALEVAATELERFADGVFFVDLSTLLEPTLVAAAVVAALRVVAGGGNADERVVNFLVDRHVLLVLDNCEHLLDAVAAIVDRVLSACPNVRILATSREPLALDGEQVWRVPSLGLPEGDTVEGIAQSEAVRLFVDRAAAVRPGFVLSTENAPAVAEICRRLDGIPLAIELAAARVAHLAPREVAARLSDRFRLLAAGRRGVQRQQTLQAVLDWSHELLSEPERALLRRLSVFSGGWTLEAAQAVCAGDDLEATAVVDVLGALVSRSLVDAEDRGDHTRYRLLETVRLYAQDRLVAAGEAEAVRTTHARWFLDHVESLGHPGYWPSFASPALAAELDNVRQAADWWRAQERYDLLARVATGSFVDFEVQARFDETAEWVNVALAHEGDLPRALRARCHAAWAAVLEMRGEFYVANERARVAIALAGDPADAGDAYALLAANLTWIDPDEAERLLARAAEWTTSLGSAAADFIRSERGMLLLARHDYDRAVAELSGARPEGFGRVATFLVVAHLLREDGAAAATVLDRSLESQPMWGWPAYFVPYFRAVIAAVSGDVSAARARIADTTALVRRWKIPLGLADCVVACAIAAFHSGDLPRAAELLGAVYAATGGGLRTPMSMAIYLHYVREVRSRLDREARARARAAGATLSLEEALARELSTPPHD